MKKILTFTVWGRFISIFLNNLSILRSCIIILLGSLAFFANFFAIFRLLCLYKSLMIEMITLFLQASQVLLIYYKLIFSVHYYSSDKNLDTKHLSFIHKNVFRCCNLFNYCIFLYENSF